MPIASVFQREKTAFFCSYCTGNAPVGADSYPYCCHCEEGDEAIRRGKGIVRDADPYEEKCGGVGGGILDAPWSPMRKPADFSAGLMLNILDRQP